MKHILLIACTLISFSGQAGIFKSKMHEDANATNVQVSAKPGKEPKVIDPKTGDIKKLTIRHKSQNNDSVSKE